MCDQANKLKQTVKCMYLRRKIFYFWKVMEHTRIQFNNIHQFFHFVQFVSFCSTVINTVRYSVLLLKELT